MALKHDNSTSASKHRTVKNVLFVICVLLLLAALGFIYKRQRDRQAEFMRLKYEVVASEVDIELEPRIIEKETEE